MGAAEFLTSVVSVIPGALLDYAVIALVLKLPLKLKFVWAMRGFPLALVLMAALHAWQEPIMLSSIISLFAVAAARLAQFVTAWVSTLRAPAAAVRRAAA
jgi:hypothetical protein